MRPGFLKTIRPCGPQVIALFFLLAVIPVAVAEPHYQWLDRAPSVHNGLMQRISPPTGFVREATAPGSFAHWLRRLPLKAPGSPVLLHNGRLKPNQRVHAAVVDIDVGARDLQQCADAVMRLRAEYLYARGRYSDIHFNFTGGTKVPFSRWSRGERPRVKGRHVSWRRGARRGLGRKNFKQYLRMIFSYAGTYSLSRELESVALTDIRAGDVFIKGGFPGHAVLVADVVRHKRTGERRFLLIQSFMPAQDMHVLKNPKSFFGSPWYKLPDGDHLTTPEWTFAVTSLKRFRE